MAAWTRVHDKLLEGEMPPKDKPQPTPAEREQIDRMAACGTCTSSRWKSSRPKAA